MPDYYAYDGIKTVCTAHTWKMQKDCDMKPRLFGLYCTYYSTDGQGRCDNPVAQKKALEKYNESR